MWRPGFDFAERRRARLYGLHRSLCVYSHIHRGTPERPGLVMGLDLGGSCDGIVYGIMPEAREATLAYLRSREQVTMVYREITCKVRFGDGSPPADAVTYAVDRDHLQYAGKLSIDEQVKLVHQGRGQSGACRDYVLNTVRHLRDMSIHDGTLERLAARL